MTPHFSETAPGVHTATLTNPRTEKCHNIAVIESCGTWQLFINGELAVPDLPSFDDAVAAAQARVMTRPLPNMVRAAGLVAVLTFAGASVFGASTLIGAVLNPPEIAATTKSAAAPAQDFKRVTPVTPVLPDASIKTTPNTPASPTDAVVVTVVTDAPPVAATLPAPEITPISDAVVETVTIRSEPTSSIAERTGQPAPVLPTPALPVGSTTAAADPAPNNLTALDQGNENVSIPLPTRAPVPVDDSARPLIRHAIAPIAPELLREIEREEAEPVAKRRAKASGRDDHAEQEERKEPATTRRRDRRAKQLEPRRRYNTDREQRRRASARVRHEPRVRTAGQRMVCIAHSCKFR